MNQTVKKNTLVQFASYIINVSIAAENLDFDDRTLQSKIEDSDNLLSSLKKSLAEKEEKFSTENLKLKRALEEEEFNKVVMSTEKTK